MDNSRAASDTRAACVVRCAAMTNIESPPPAVPPMCSPAVWLATGFGVGLIACPPGTIGALVWGMPLAWAIGRLPEIGWQAVAIVLLVTVGVPICTAAGRALGSKKDN